MSAYSWIPRQPFEDTNWLTVHSLARGGSEADPARENLCRLYWYPLYAYVRKQGRSPEDAQELTQEFLCRLIWDGNFGSLDPVKGKFRAFLLAAMNNFLANEWRKEQAQKRGGGKAVFSINADEAEARFASEPAQCENPARFYDLQWARLLMARTLSKMREEYYREDKPFLFEELKAVVEDDQEDETLAAIARRLHMAPDAFRKALERFRTQYQERLQAEVSLTVSIAGQVDEETRFIRKVLRG